MTTRLTDNRRAALAVGYMATDWTEPVTFKSYKERLASWDVQLIERDGVGIGAAYFSQDGEAHVSVLSGWRKRWATVGLIRELLRRAAWTRVTDGHDHMFGILERLGFSRCEDGTMRRQGNGH